MSTPSTGVSTPIVSPVKEQQLFAQLVILGRERLAQERALCCQLSADALQFGAAEGLEPYRRAVQVRRMNGAVAENV